MGNNAFVFSCGFAAGIGAVFIYLRILRTTKQEGWFKRKKRFKETQRATTRRPNCNVTQAEIHACEDVFFTGMDNIMRLSVEQLNLLRQYLSDSLSDGGDVFIHADSFKDILVKMRDIELITPRSYGRLEGILKEAGIDPQPRLMVQIERLSNAIDDIRDGYDPPGYQAGSFEFDAVIIHCDEDREGVITFIGHAGDMLKIRNLSFTTMDDFNISKPKLEGLATVFSRAMFVYVFVTENLRQDDLSRFMADMALTDSLIDPAKKNRFIPIWATETRVRISQLEQFNGLKYYRYFKSESDQDRFSACFQDHIRKGRAAIYIF